MNSCGETEYTDAKTDGLRHAEGSNYGTTNSVGGVQRKSKKLNKKNEAGSSKKPPGTLNEG